VASPEPPALSEPDQETRKLAREDDGSGATALVGGVESTVVVACAVVVKA
jgi:hypothetical protein